MKRVFEKLKPVLLLLSMSLVSFGIVWVVNQFKKEPIDTEIQSNYEISKNLQAQVENVIDTSQPEKIGEVRIVNSNTNIQTTGEILGEENVSCGSAINIESQSICYRAQENEGLVDYQDGTRSGDKVSKESEIKLVSVTVPLELFSGMEVADSNRKITSETPTYKAAGEQVDDITANAELPPGNQIDTYKDSTEDKPFTTSYSVGRGTDTSADISEEGKIGVNSKLENQCDSEEYNNKSNVTPTKSNARSEFMLDTYRYPNEKKVEEEQLEVIEQCNESKDKFIAWDTDLKGCYDSLWSRAISFIQTFDDLFWNKCLIDEEECVSVEDIVIIMASPFGSDEACGETGVCTNSYMDRRNKIAQSPSADTSGKTYYTTDCGVIIEGKSYTVKCAWDMSHLYKELKVSEFDDIPNVESTPTPEEYNNFLQNNVKGKRNNPIPL